MHDLRLALRDSAKKLEEAENVINKLRKDYETQLQKKDEVISMKESIIKEKDGYITQLEQEIIKYDPTFIGTSDIIDGANSTSSGRPSFLDVPSSAKQRTKRTAISAEPAQHKKSKDFRVVLQSFDKSDRSVYWFGRNDRWNFFFFFFFIFLELENFYAMPFSTMIS